MASTSVLEAAGNVTMAVLGAAGREVMAHVPALFWVLATKYGAQAAAVLVTVLVVRASRDILGVIAGWVLFLLAYGIPSYLAVLAVDMAMAHVTVSPTAAPAQ